ncbi:GIY-YIG family nuclease [uncultured virus]|nr:GIY-YIG family nuclease [uncultured virus]
MEKIGIVYKITNLRTKKIYIGQTSISEEYKELGTINRWKQHVYAANGKKLGCRRFYKAIRKYKPTSFKINTLVFCKLDQLNQLEIDYIYIYNSTNKRYGYNLSKGGQGINSEMSEGKRKSISLGQGCDYNKMGIIDKFRDGKLVGYRAQRKQNGRKYDKLFSDQNKTLEENFNSAQKYLEDIKNNTLEKYKLFNRKDNLPQNILFEKNEKHKNIGFRFQIKTKQKIYCKVFTNSCLSMDEKYNLAIEAKNKFIDNKKKFNDKQLCEKEYNEYLINLCPKPKLNPLPKNIKKITKQGKLIGYAFKIKKNMRIYQKTFVSSKFTLEEKLNLTLKSKEEYFNNL